MGFHIPFSGSIKKFTEEIKRKRGNTIHFFCRGLRGVNPKTKERFNLKKISTKSLERYYSFLTERQIGKVIMHAPVSYNLAHSNEELINCLLADLEFAKQMKVTDYVVQPGYYNDLHPFEAVENIKSCLNEVLDLSQWDGDVLIKNMAGAGTEIAHELEEWNELISFHPKIKGAFDVARAYTSGIGLDVLYESVARNVGWEKVRLVYLNDTLKTEGSRKNKFCPLGEGSIGFQGYKDLLPLLSKTVDTFIIENQPSLMHIDSTIDFFTAAIRK